MLDGDKIFGLVTHVSGRICFLRIAALLGLNDHERLTALLTQYMDRFGFSVRSAIDPKAGLRTLKSDPPDIVILDIGMPSLNGLEATRQILKIRPQTKVLILTMHESDSVIREVLDAGARGYILKTDAGRDLVDRMMGLRVRQ